MSSLRTLFDLSGRVALVTGACGHLGRVICETLAEQGAGIVALDRHGTQAFADELSQRGVTAMGLDVDLADEQAVRAVPALIEQRMGGLAVLVNNAAFVGTSGLQGWVAPFMAQSADTWRLAMEVNLTSAFVLSQACTPLLKASGHGSIVNVASLYGHLGPDWSLYEGTAMGNPAAYAASKGGLIQMSRWLATTLGPDIRVNAISPGGIARGQPDAFRHRYEARTPLRRMGCEDDFKGIIALLCSDASAYVTGQNIAVDGGWSAW
ncbi:MAG: SDR family oxidoreductase [Aquabacterium sp.]